MDYDAEKVNEAALALLYLWSWQEYGTPRAWKGFDWDVLAALHEQGWISDPQSKAKSITLTEDGVAKAQEAAAKYFGNPAGESVTKPEAPPYSPGQDQLRLVK